MSDQCGSEKTAEALRVKEVRKSTVTERRNPTEQRTGQDTPAADRAAERGWRIIFEKTRRLQQGFFRGISLEKLEKPAFVYTFLHMHLKSKPI